MEYFRNEVFLEEENKKVYMLRILSPLLILYLGVLIPYNLFSQNYQFHHITTIDGLSHNEVRKIVKDSYGYLWLGTQNGLTRHDGHNFEIYKASNSGFSYRIQGDKVYALAASSNKIWVGTTTGLSIINSKTGAVLDNDIQDHELSKLKRSFIHSIFSASNDDIWISSEAGNFIINTSDYSSREILEGHKIFSFVENSNENMWISTNKGVVLYDVNQHQIIDFYSNLGQVEDFYIDQFGMLWAASSAGVFRFAPEKKKFLNMYFSHGVNAIAETKKGDMLFSSYGNGLTVYSREAEVFYKLKSDPKDQMALSSNDLYDLLVDNEGLIWVGTQEGLDVYDWTRHRFKKLIHDPDNEKSLSNNFIQAIYKDKDGVFWFGTRDKGIDKVRFENNDYNKPIFEHVYPKDNEEKGLWGNYITSIVEDSNNRIWVASFGKGLNLYNKIDNSFQHFLHNKKDPHSIASNSVSSIIEDHLGRMWFGTLGGLSMLEENNKGEIKFRNFYHDKRDDQSLNINTIFKVFQDSKNRIWIGMNNGGINLVHEEKDGNIWFESFKYDNENENSLSSNEVFVIYEDSKNRMWFGTSSGGLNVLTEEQNSKTKGINYSFKRYTENEGLSDNEVNSIVEDVEGKLWVATNKGISHFDPEQEVFTNYTTYDGVLKGKFRKNSVYKNTDGTLFFGGTAGVNYFNPGAFKKNNITPKPRFTALFIDGNKIKEGQKIAESVVLNEPLNSGATISLSQRHNSFEIHFTALSFASPLRNTYQYKLEGIDTGWMTTNSENLKANYFNLPGGEYKFLLKVANNDGLWNSEPIHLNIIVESTIIETLTKHSKLLLVICLSLIGVFAVNRYKKRKLKSKRRYKKEFEKGSKTNSTIKNKNVTKEDKLIIEQLKISMDKDKLYLNPLLNLQLLADKLNITSNHLSLILNDCMGTNFYDFINAYRVEEVKRRLGDPKYKNQTLLSISGDCGFNSKSAFNRIFKNFTGKTPSQFQKELK